MEPICAFVGKVSAHVRRIEAVEKELKALSESSATKEDISRVRAEMKKLYDGLHVGMSSRILCKCGMCVLMSLHSEFLDLRAHVWGIRECSILLITIALNSH